MSAKKPQRLGMGLSALLGDAGQPGAAAQTLAVAAIEPGPFQPRGAMDQAALADLTASIREHGILQPILVRPKPGAKGIYQIIGGERRWRAAQMVPLHQVPVLIRDLDDRAALAAALVENLQREDLNPLEEADGYQRLTREFGLTQDALGKAVGKSRSHVANMMRLLGLPARIKDLLGSGSLSAGHARALLTATDPVKLAEQVVTRGLNVRQTEVLAAAGTRRRSPRMQDPETRAVERDLTARLGLKVGIRHGPRGGTLTIAYSDLDQLDGLIRLLSPDA